MDNIQTVLNIKSAMNKGGISDTLLSYFPDTIAVTRPEVQTKAIPNPNWVSGFIEGEGNFAIKILKNSKYKSGYSARVWFQVNQHYRDDLLIKEFISFFGCGVTYKDTNGMVTYFVVSKLSDIMNIIIPFFEKHPLQGSKLCNYLDFKTGAIILNNKEHLNSEGLVKLQNLKAALLCFSNPPD